MGLRPVWQSGLISSVLSHLPGKRISSHNGLTLKPQWFAPNPMHSRRDLINSAKIKKDRSANVTDTDHKMVDKYRSQEPNRLTHLIQT